MLTAFSSKTAQNHQLRVRTNHLFGPFCDHRVPGEIFNLYISHNYHTINGMFSAWPVPLTPKKADSRRKATRHPQGVAVWASGLTPLIRAGQLFGLIIAACGLLGATTLHAQRDYGDYSGFGSASSEVSSLLRLGATVTTEGNDLSNSTANGDLDDGVTVPPEIRVGRSTTLFVTLTNATGAVAYLNSWLDANGNGTLSNTLVSAGGDRLHNQITIGSSPTPQVIPITFTLPVGTAVGGTVGLRFRLTSTSNPGPTGNSGTGEVEDYLTTLTARMDDGGTLPTLEFTAGAGNPSQEGSVVAPQVITLQSNPTNPLNNVLAPANAPATATFEFINQQFNPSASAMPTRTGMSFGSPSASGAADAGTQLFPVMNSISGPVANQFTSASFSSPGQGITPGFNRGVAIFTSANALAELSLPSNGRFYFGDLRITFSRAMDFPVLQLVGIGAIATVGSNSLGMSAELELVTPGIVLTRLSGSSELVVREGTKILNQAAIPGPSTGQGAGSGSILVGAQAVTTLTFRIYMRGDGGLPTWTNDNNGVGDLWLVGFTESEPDLDFGDSSVVATASSWAKQALTLGSQIDAERNAITDPLALGDDLNGIDDEDGLTLPVEWLPGQSVTATAQVRNLTGANAWLNVWVDFNGNGQLTEANERVITNRVISPSSGLQSIPLNIAIPANATNGFATVRARLANASNAPPTGFFGTGEVEDYRVWIGSSLVVCPANAVLPRAIQGSPYELALTPSGGTGPYLYQITSGTLPLGLALDPATGIIGGTPINVQSQSFTVRITDSTGTHSNRNYQLQVIPTAGILNASASENNVPISSAKILLDGSQLITQNGSSVGAPVVRTGSIDLVELTVLDSGQLRTLSVANRGGGIVANVNVPSNSTLYGVANQGVVQTMAALGLEQFKLRAGETASNTNLNNYLVDGSPDGLPDGNSEFDFLFHLPYQLNDYIILSERFGNSSARLTPLNSAGEVIPGSNPIQFTPPYDWNTGYSSPIIPDQPYWLICVRATAFGVTQPIHGFRVDTSGADIKFFGLSETGFTTTPVPPASLGDFVWADLNGNGLQDPEEPGVPGIPVELLNAADGVVLKSTLTDATGHYLFENVRQGDYRIRFSGGPNYRPTSVNVGSNRSLDSDAHPLTGLTAPFTLQACETRLDLDAGLVLVTCPTLAISPPDLLNAREDLPYLATFTGTGGIGPYLFTLQSGSLPSWAVLNSTTGTLSGTPDAAGTFNFTVRAADQFGCSITRDYTLTVEERPKLGIGNLIFVDDNDNGYFDDGEGRANVPVELYGALQFPGIDTPLATTISGPDGSYFFGDLNEGLYKVHVPAAAFQTNNPLQGATVISDIIAGDDDVGQDGIYLGEPALFGVSTGVVSLFLGAAPTGSSGETGFKSDSDDDLDAAIDLTIDFGFRYPVGIGNLVFIDKNRNGRYDSDEGTTNVRVELYPATSQPGVDLPILVQNTNANGVYFFDQLLPGDYRVFIPPSEFGPGRPLEGTLSITGTRVDGDDDVGENGIDDFLPQQNGIQSGIVSLQRGLQPTDFTFETGAFNHIDNRRDEDFNLTIDFGFATVDPDEVGVGNLVFVDSNGNSKYDTGEGIEGVVIQLFHASANPQTDSPLDEIVTSTGGLYLFRGLVEGSYFVHVPASQFQVGAPLAGLKSIPGHGGDWGLDDDFDENGVDAPEPWLTGISSTPFFLSPGTEPTNEWGEFGESFEMDDANDANFDLTIDLGFSTPMGIGNLVFFDSNSNGRADLGEGIADVTIQLFPFGAQPAFDLPLAVTTTDADGFYLFDNLSPGSYFLHLPFWQFFPGGTLAGLQLLGGPTEGDDDVGQNGLPTSFPSSFGISSTLVTLEPGTAPAGGAESGLRGDSDHLNDHNIDLTIDFGFGPPATLGDLIFYDVNGDGLFQPAGADGILNTADDEVGLADVAIELWSPGPDGVIGGGDDFLIDNTKQTDFTGRYLFPELSSGVYYLVIPATNFAPGGSLQVLASSSPEGSLIDAGIDNRSHGIQPGGRGTDVRSPLISLMPGQTKTTVDFGFVANIQPLTWAEWQLRNGALADTSPTGNSDGDEYSNLAEFAFGLKAGSGVMSRQPLRLIHDPVTGRIDLAIQRVTDLTGATVTLQVIADLSQSPAGWANVTAPAPVIQHRNDGTEDAVYQNVSSLPQLFGNSGFARVQITLDSDQNGTPEAVTYSPVVGWARRTFGTQLQTLGHSFAAPAILVGKVDAVTGNTLDLGTSLASVSIRDVLAANTAYHVEVLSGPQAGHRIDVHYASSNGSLVAIDVANERNTLTNLPDSLIALVDQQIALRPHLTLGTLADHSLFRGTNNPATADRLLIHHAPTNSFRTYWLAAFGQIRSWLLHGSSDLVDQSKLVIEPGRGVFIHPKFQPVSLLLQGQVRSHPFALTLKNNLTFSSTGWPLPLSPAQLGMSHTSGFVGTRTSASADQIQTYRGDTVPGSNLFDSYFYLRIGTLLDQWTRTGDSSLPNLNATPLFQPHRAAFIRSVDRLPFVLLPSPWQAN